MQKTVCAACGETGGRFIFRSDKYYHASRCTKPAKVRGLVSTFPFTTNQFEPNDGPVTVQSIHHLRRLESQHGVASEVYNNNQSYQGEKY